MKKKKKKKREGMLGAKIWLLISDGILDMKEIKEIYGIGKGGKIKKNKKGDM